MESDQVRVVDTTNGEVEIKALSDIISTDPNLKVSTDSALIQGGLG